MIRSKKISEWLNRIKWIMLCNQCDINPDTFELKTNECACQQSDIHVKRIKYLCSTRCKLCGKLIHES